MWFTMMLKGGLGLPQKAANNEFRVKVMHFFFNYMNCFFFLFFFQNNNQIRFLKTIFIEYGFKN